MKENTCPHVRNQGVGFLQFEEREYNEEFLGSENVVFPVSWLQRCIYFVRLHRNIHLISVPCAAYMENFNEIFLNGKFSCNCLN